MVLRSTYASQAAPSVLVPRGTDLDMPARQSAPSARQLWRHDSPALAQLLAEFWYTSDNLVGEVLLKELGVHHSGAPGHSETGIAAELQFLQGAGVDPASVDLHDGSGLSRYDRFTPQAFAAILQHDWNGPHRDVVLDALPVAGVRGSMAGDFTGTPVAQRLFGKTGSYMHVRSVSAISPRSITER